MKIKLLGFKIGRKSFGATWWWFGRAAEDDAGQVAAERRSTEAAVYGDGHWRRVDDQLSLNGNFYILKFCYKISFHVKLEFFY